MTFLVPLLWRGVGVRPKETCPEIDSKTCADLDSG